MQGYLIDKKTAKAFGINNIAQLKDPNPSFRFEPNLQKIIKNYY
jgi:hypothetical protein